MTVKITKPDINVREKLTELHKPSGVAGEAMLRAETPREQFNLVNAGRRNLLTNGDMRIAQAGTSINVIGTGSYQSVDRWRIQSNLNQTTHTWAQVADAPDGFKYSAKLTVGTGFTPTGSDFGRVYQRFETRDARHLGWGTNNPEPITLSFWVKSSITGKYGGTFSANGTGTYHFAYTVNTANTWEYKTYTVISGMLTFGADSDDYGIGFGVHFDLGEGPSRSSVEGPQPTNNSGSMGLSDGIKILATSGATWQITGVQLEQGKFATPFEHRSYGEELALCQRFYQVYDTLGSGVWNSATSFFCSTSLPVAMRVVPTITMNSGTYSNINIEHVDTYDITGVSPSHASSAGENDPWEVSTFITVISVSNTRTVGDAGVVVCDQNNDFFRLDAEL